MREVDTGTPYDEIMRRIIQELLLALRFYADRESYKNILIYPENDAGPFAKDCRAPEGWAFKNWKTGKPQHRKHFGVLARTVIDRLEKKYGSLDIYLRNSKWKGRPRAKKNQG